MFCTKCGFPVRWVVPEEAMALSQSSLREIFRKIETGNLHFVETADGFLLVCCNSLTREITTSGETRNEIEIQLIAA